MSRTLILVLTGVFLFGGKSEAAVVVSGGYDERFGTQPPTSNWATLNVTGSSSDNYDMDADVRARITGDGVAAEIIAQTGNPPSPSTNATWSSTGLYLQLRPTANRYTALMGKFENATGTNWPRITFSYILTIAGASGVIEETGKGTRVYYSFSGLPNSWTNMPALNTTVSANSSTNVRAVINAPWVNGGTLFLLWVDDNASGSGIDSANQIDNFSLPEASTNEFLVMLDELEAASTPALRGSDQGISSYNNIGNRVVAMIGSAETWDPYGTPALRNAVIARWRSRWAAEGDSMLRGLTPPKPFPGHASVTSAGVHLERGLADMRTPYFLNNGVLYELGEMDGAFPPMAFMLGDQSGIWAPPVKALDGFEFLIRESGMINWSLADSAEFAHDFASARWLFVSNGWRIERLDFPVAGRPALFSRLTISNTTVHTRTADIDFVARFNVRPDWRTTAQNNQRNDLDSIQASDGFLRAWDANLPRSLVIVGSDSPADEVSVIEPTGRLTHHVMVDPGGSTTLNFLILAGLEANDVNATIKFRDLVSNSEAELVAARELMTDRVTRGVDFSCSDPRLADAFRLAKANIALLTADYRPYFPDVFLSAGVPVYPRLFANDSCISLPGVMAAGLTAETGGTLSCLAAQARAHGALVPHESATDGSRIGSANAQETPQFIATCARHLHWSTDRALIASLYPLLKDALAAQRAKDTDGDGYPEGGALIETPGGGREKVDAACWQYAALVGLSEIARELGIDAEATMLDAEASVLKAAIQRDWWVPTNAMWADSLDAANQPMSAGVWSVVFPLLTGVATPEQAQLTLQGLQSGWVNQWGGVHTRETNITDRGSGLVTTELFSSAAFAHGQPEFGFRLLQLAAGAPRQPRMPGGLTETIPPGGSDFVQLWSAGPLLEAVIEGLAGIRPYATQHRADFLPALPHGLEWFKLKNLRFGEHEFTLEHRRTGYRNTATLRHDNGPIPFAVRFFSSTNATFTLNGRLIQGQLTDGGQSAGGSFAPCELGPGDSLVATFRETTPLPFALIPSDSDWKYLDDGSDQGTSWRGIQFNDAGWKTGSGPFGYGDGDEATLIRSNRLDNTRITTSYFRKPFIARNAWAMTNLTIGVVRDDGAAVFLNGTEVFRSNLTPGTINHLTAAQVAVNGGNESVFFETNISPELLLEGTNVLAVEVHQQTPSSSDVSFNLTLNALGFDRIELSAQIAGQRVFLGWPVVPAGFSLESSRTLSSDAAWQAGTNLVTVTNGENRITIELPSVESRFFRLRRGD